MIGVIRTDASVAIGTGHLMRCLTLATALREQGAELAFVCRGLLENCTDLIIGQGFPVFHLPAISRFDPLLDADQTVVTPFFSRRPDWLIVDHYGLGMEWESRLRPCVRRLMVIDDLANRAHECDVFLDQNLSSDLRQQYDNLLPHGCRKFIGPRYTLLRDEFIEARRNLRERNGTVKRVLVFFGGSDPTNETEKALLALKQLNRANLDIDVVIGSANQNGFRIRSLSATMPNVTFHCQIANMAALMSLADLAIGAGGTTMWERCFLGLPALIIVVAANQSKPALAAKNAGLVFLAGNSEEISVDTLSAAIRQVLLQPNELKEMTSRCLALMGHRSGAVNDEILACLHEVTDEP